MSQSNQFVVASPPTLLHVIDIYIGDYDDDKNDHNDDDDENIARIANAVQCHS